MDTKQYELSVTEGQSYIYARVYVPVTKELILELLKEAISRVTEHGVCGLLIDAHNMPNFKTVIDDYDIAYYHLREFGFMRYLRSAIITKLEDRTHSFFETCALNAGYDWRVFSDLDHASEWLNAEQIVFMRC